MKIKELRLKNFGKFTNKEIHFLDGMNVIYGENESGKSTLYTFIRAMLLGWNEGVEELRRRMHFPDMNRGKIRIIIVGK
ncbi:MAG: ATP-binding protein [Dorea formicigenerans]